MNNTELLGLWFVINVVVGSASAILLSYYCGKPKEKKE